MEEIKISTPGNLKPLPYEISEEVKSIAEKILNGLTTHAKIAYVASYKQSKWIGKCQLVPAVFKLLTGYDYIIYVNMEYYEGLSYKQKEALLFHELEHIGWKQNINLYNKKHCSPCLIAHKEHKCCFKEGIDNISIEQIDIAIKELI